MAEFRDTDFLWHEKLADGVWRVVEDWGGPQKICVYVIEGSQKTAIIDSGCGATHGIRRYIEENITSVKPMICLLTHTHPDHCGGCTLFDEQYVCSEELDEIAWNINDQRRVHDAASFAYSGVPGSKPHGDASRAMRVWEYCKENYVPVDWKSIRWNFVKDKDVIDLGDKKLSCIYMNVHGTMIYYLKEYDFAFCGDNVTYTLAVINTKEDYIGKFQQLSDKTTPETIFYSGHIYYNDMITRPCEIDGKTLSDIIQAFKHIKSGEWFEDDKPAEFYDCPTPDIPSLNRYTPETDDPDVLCAYNLRHRNAGVKQSGGIKYTHNVGPVIITYERKSGVSSE